jgi:hypothetical protein
MALAFGAGAGEAAAAEGPALRRVLLSTGGVGYFEYEATVDGPTLLPIDVRIDQVDDVLKSIVVYDERGNLGEITLPGKDALREMFRDLPFGPQALNSAADLLGALRGAEVRVQAADRVLEGRIVSVTAEQVQTTTGATTRHRLALESGGALLQVILEDAQRLEFIRPELQKQVDNALAAIAKQGEDKRRELTVHIGGEGRRVVNVAYVAGAPLWKSSYRLTLGAPGAKTAALQGWAVVENRSGHDWNQIELTLVSGNPVTFRQALYDAYYIQRPEVPVEVVGRVLPRLDQEPAPAGAPKFVPHRGYGGRGGYRPGGLAAPSVPEATDAVPPAEPAVEQVEEATQVVLRFHEPVTIRDGESALLPIIARDIPAERVSLYQPETQARRPLASVRIENDGATALPPGVVTIYERAGKDAVFAGDARLTPLPPGEARLATFAVDQKMDIDRKESGDQIVTVASIVDGALKLTRTERRTTDYTIHGAAGEPRAVIIEHPRLDGFRIAQPADAVETPERYRIRRDLQAGATIGLRVVLERPEQESVILSNLSDEQVRAYASGTELPPAVREAMIRVAALRATVADADAKQRAIVAERAQILEDQTRIRENIKVLPPTAEVVARYLTTLGEQEDRLRALDRDRAAAQRALDKARQALAEYVRGLKLLPAGTPG